MVKGGNAPVEIRGTAKYAKLVNLDTYGKWSCAIYPDQESMVKVHKLISEGVKNSITKDDDGYKIVFSRPPNIKLKSGEIRDMGPVMIKDHNGHILTDVLVADGSDITMKLETYGGKSPTGRGTYKAARLAEITIH